MPGNDYLFVSSISQYKNVWTLELETIVQLPDRKYTKN